MLELREVRKQYKLGSETLTVINGVSVTIQPGTFVALVGPSGCGKSTLLNVIGGLDRADSGQVLFHGADMTMYDDQQLERYRLENIGTIFQSFNLISHMNVLENVETPMALAGLGKRERRKRATELLKLVGLGDHLKHRPNQLSGGQKQRVAIARAIALEPDVILADEPTGALDTATGEQIMDLLKEICQKKGTTIVMVTHALELAEQADHIIEMSDGRVVNERKQDRVEPTRATAAETGKKNMSLGSAMRMAFGNMKQKKWRTLLVSIGASIGICGIALMLGLTMGLEEKVKQELSSSITENALKVSIDEEGKQQPDDAQLAKIKDIPGVADAYQVYLFTGGFLLGDNSVADSFQSLKPEGQITKKEKEALIAGELPKDDKSILLSEAKAKALLGEGKKAQDIVGREVTMILRNDGADVAIADTKEFKIKVSGVVKDGGLMSSSTGVQYEFAKKLSRDLDPNGKAHPINTLVVVKTADELDNIKKKIKELNLVVKSDEERMSSITKYSTMIEGGLSMFGGISLVVSSIMIGIVLYISVLERTREIGVLRAIGARKIDIRRIFLTEAGLIGVFGGLIGLFFASLWVEVGNFAIQELMGENAFDAFSLPTNLVLFCLLFSTVLSFIAGWFPASRASHLNPIDALRHE